jgi:hypothetical protein
MTARMQQGNGVSSFCHAPGNEFVVTSLGGTCAVVQPVSEYDKALHTAQFVANGMRAIGKPCPISVLRVSLSELLTLIGVYPESYLSRAASKDGSELRTFAVRIFFESLCESESGKVRTVAWGALKSMGMVM